jgi:hypothetical protein
MRVDKFQSPSLYISRDAPKKCQIFFSMVKQEIDIPFLVSTLEAAPASPPADRTQIINSVNAPKKVFRDAAEEHRPTVFTPTYDYSEYSASVDHYKLECIPLP